MQITPLILGRGRAGQAISKSLVNLGIIHPQFQIDLPVGLERGANLKEERKKYAHPVLCISNPHGLHADAIIEASLAGFEAIICEKPACVNSEQLKRLKEIQTPVAVLHGYRQTWGVQTLKQMILAGEMGELITLEGRYWQSSTAERALSQGPVSNSWKNDTRLAGETDTFLDIATHWVDAASFLYGSLPTQIHGWKTNVNSEAPHRDSHVQLVLEYPKNGRGLSSISKTVHGATNHFELNVLGTQKSATWNFLNPDEILIGEGRDRRVLTRKTTEMGSHQTPFHGLGWIEGYMEIAYGLLSEVFEGNSASYPRLQENLALLEVMFKTRW